MKVKSESEVAQSYPTLSNPMDCSLPGSSIHGIFFKLLNASKCSGRPSVKLAFENLKTPLVTQLIAKNCEQVVPRSVNL